jgi:hypothetical protein
MMDYTAEAEALNAADLADLAALAEAEAADQALADLAAEAEADRPALLVGERQCETHGGNRRGCEGCLAS